MRNTFLQNLFLQFKTLFGNICSEQKKIDAFSFVKPYDFQRKQKEKGHDSQKLIPLNAMFVGVLNHKNKFSKNLFHQEFLP